MELFFIQFSHINNLQFVQKQHFTLDYKKVQKKPSYF